ncbi:MAG TPA: helix-turn-helix domain-containing protein [Roseiflexaceae bacterium]|jgi:hypothetical protein|nr:helix-turn-helix domain-containing protein [Roseiflexaceae bacterium]
MHDLPLLSVYDVAIRLSISEHTVINRAKNGTLPAQMVDGVYRFQPDVVAAYANANPDADPDGDGKINDLIRP